MLEVPHKEVLQVNTSLLKQCSVCACMGTSFSAPLEKKVDFIVFME
jgi:hypothetical protein